MSNVVKKSCGRGLVLSVVGDEVTISFNKKADFGKSKGKAGKTIVASSDGFLDLGDGVKMGLNAIK